VPKTSTSAPPSGPRKGIPIHRSRRYSCLKYIFFITDYLVNCEPLCRIPHDINPAPSAKSVLVSSEFPKVDKPLNPQAKKTTPEPSKPSSPTGAQSPIYAGGTPTSPCHMASGQDAVNNSPRLELAEHPEMPH
jgi:hypothetical protein